MSVKLNKQNKKQQQIDTSLAHDLDVSQLLEVEVTLRFQAIHLATAPGQLGVKCPGICWGVL